MDAKNSPFLARLDAVAAETQTLLDRLLTATLAEGESNRPARLLEAMRYSSLGGGKRFRPFLVVESAALFGVPGAQALMVGAALECWFEEDFVTTPAVMAAATAWSQLGVPLALISNQEPRRARFIEDRTGLRIQASAEESDFNAAPETIQEVAAALKERAASCEKSRRALVILYRTMSGLR